MVGSGDTPRLAVSREPARRLAPSGPASRKRNPSVCVCAWIVLHPEISNTAARFLVVLAQHANRDGAAWPALDTVKARAGMSRRSAQRAVSELLNHPQRPITRKLRRNTSPIYALTLAAIEAPNRVNRKGAAPVAIHAPGGAVAGLSGVATDDTPGTPPVTRSLGDTSGALTLRNLVRTDNGASNEGRAGRPGGIAALAGWECSARQLTPSPNVCDVCGRPAENAWRGGYFCDLHLPEPPKLWTRSGGRL